jgi:hypothetical protein
MCWTVTLADESGDTVVIDCPRSVSIEVAGDCEQGAFLAALEQMVATLRAAGITPNEIEPPEVIGMFGRFAPTETN